MDVTPVSKMRTCQDFKMCMSLRQACPGLHACRMQAHDNPIPQPEPITRGAATKMTEVGFVNSYDSNNNCTGHIRKRLPLGTKLYAPDEPFSHGIADEPPVRAEDGLELVRKLALAAFAFTLTWTSVLALLWHYDKPLRAALRSAWEVISYAFWF